MSAQPNGDELKHTFYQLYALYRAEPYPSLSTRLAWLERLAYGISQAKEALIQAVNADYGTRSAIETSLAELFPTFEGIAHAKQHLKHWMAPQKRGVTRWFWPGKNQIIPQPLGVVGIIAPWNYPIYLTLGPLIGALAAGNRVMIKVSENTPHTESVLHDMLEEALGSSVVHVVNSSLTDAQHFSQLSFAHLLFTGSGKVGSEIMRTAAEHLTPVTLELGGKSPALIAPDADIHRAAISVVRGKMLNAGQTCVAPDYVLVAKKDSAAFVEALKEAASHAYPSLANNIHYSSIINTHHYQRLQSWLEQARAAGAKIEEINPANESCAEARKMGLTLVQHCPEPCELMRNEIFGPILPIIPYDSLDDALGYINQRPTPLALYLFSDDPDIVEGVLCTTVSGGVTVNDTLLHVLQDDLPFGGVGQSGMGHYHGRDGFTTFSKMKPVFYQSRFNSANWLSPPYNARTSWLLKWMLK